jgi:hypothetical protein
MQKDKMIIVNNMSYIVISDILITISGIEWGIVVHL